MYVRFVLPSAHAEDGVRVGPFEVAHRLRREEEVELPDVDWYVLDETLDWFRDELRVPHRTYCWYRGWKDGYCWFKDSAKEHISQMRVLGSVLDRHGYPLTMIHGRRPGKVLYEDEHQILAVPYRDSYVG